MTDQKPIFESPRDVVQLDRPHHPGIVKLDALWQSKRRGPLLPSRADLDPAQFKPLLPNIILLDVLPPPDFYRIRVAGEAVQQFYGRSIIGLTPHQYLGPEGAQVLIDLLERLVNDRAPVFRAGHAHWWPDKSYKRFETAAFPLAADGERVNMIISVLILYD